MGLQAIVKNCIICIQYVNNSDTFKTTYGYIYFYAYHNHESQLLIMALFNALITITAISINLHYFMYKFDNDLIRMNLDHTFKKLIDQNLEYLTMFSIM